MHRKSPPDRWWSRRAAAVVVVHIRHQGGRFVGGSLSGGYPKEMENTAQIAISWLCRLPAQSGDGDQGGYRPRGPATSPGSGSAASTRGPSAPASLRRRLGLSQMALARLMGVSAPAVAHWEAGESTPTGRNRVTLVALRKVRKREVKELLARRVKETASRASHSRRRRPKRPRRR
jgi:hypothetical protein